MEQQALTESQLRTYLKEFSLFQGKYLTRKQLSKFYGIEENTVKNYLKKEAGQNGHPKMFGEDYIKSHNEGWANGDLTVIDPEEAIRFYLTHKDKLGKNFINKTGNQFIYLDKNTNTSPVQETVYIKEETIEKEQGNLNPKPQENILDEAKLVEILQKVLGENKNLGNQHQDLTWYVDELKKQIDDLKTEKDKEIEDLKTEKKDIEKELKEETKRVEKVYFISERFDKVINSQKAAMTDMIRMSQSLSAGEKIKLGEIKKLLSNLGSNEKVEIEENGNIRLIEDRSSGELTLAMQSIPDDLILERSRGDEFDKLRKSKIFWIIVSSLFFITTMALVIAKALKVF